MRARRRELTRQAVVVWCDRHIVAWNYLSEVRDLAVAHGDRSAADRLNRKRRSLERGLLRVHRILETLSR